MRESKLYFDEPLMVSGPFRKLIDTTCRPYGIEGLVWEDSFSCFAYSPLKLTTIIFLELVSSPGRGYSFTDQ